MSNKDVKPPPIHKDGDCDYCGGLGQVFGKIGTINETCPYCNGTGKSKEEKHEND